MWFKFLGAVVLSAALVLGINLWLGPIILLWTIFAALAALIISIAFGKNALEKWNTARHVKSDLDGELDLMAIVGGGVALWTGYVAWSKIQLEGQVATIVIGLMAVAFMALMVKNWWRRYHNARTADDMWKQAAARADKARKTTSEDALDK